MEWNHKYNLVIGGACIAGFMFAVILGDWIWAILQLPLGIINLKSGWGNTMEVV